MSRFPSNALSAVLLCNLWLLTQPLPAGADSEVPWAMRKGHPVWLAVAREMKEEAAVLSTAVPLLEGPLAWDDPQRVARFQKQRELLSALRKRLETLREKLLALPIPEKRGPRPARLSLMDSHGRRLCEAPLSVLLQYWLEVDYAAPLRPKAGEPAFRRAARIMGWWELAKRQLAVIASMAKKRSPEWLSPAQAALIASTAERIRATLDDAAALLKRDGRNGAVADLVTGEGERRLFQGLRARTYNRILAPYVDYIDHLESELVGLPRGAGEAPPAPEISTGATDQACQKLGAYRNRLQRLLDGPGLVGASRRIAGFYMNLLLPLEGLCTWARMDKLPRRQGTVVTANEEEWVRWYRRTWISLYLAEAGWTLVDPLGIEENLRILEALPAGRSSRSPVLKRLEEAEPLSAEALQAWDFVLGERMENLLGIVAERLTWYARLASLPDMHPKLLGELRKELAGKLTALVKYVDARDDLRIYMTTPATELLKQKLAEAPGVGKEVRQRLAEDDSKGTAARAQDQAIAITLAALRRAGVDLMVYLSPKRPPASPTKVMLDDFGEEELNGIINHLHLRKYFFGRLRYRLSEGRGANGFGCVQ